MSVPLKAPFAEIVLVFYKKISRKQFYLKIIDDLKVISRPYGTFRSDVRLPADRSAGY